MATPKSEGQKIAAVAQGISDDVARELAKVLRASERALLPILKEALDANRTASVKAARGLALRADILRALQQAGYDDLIDAGSNTAIEDMARTLKARPAIAGLKAFVMPNARRIAALTEIGKANLMGVAENIATNLNNAVSMWSLTVSDQNMILNDLAGVLQDNFNQAQTLFDTQVSIYGRQLEAMSTESLGPTQAFLYVGPADGRTRTWCLERVGKVYTRAQIEAMDNKQLPNPFLTGGGYNCRHSFIAVEGKELSSLLNTNKRADGFDVDMQAIQEMRRAARRSDARRLARNNQATN